MNKITSALVFFLCSCFSVCAQNEDFGILRANEMSLTECPFDKEATAIILLHEAVSNYDDEHHLITKHHIRMKILKEKGIGEADISIPFHSGDDFEFISNMEAITINTDANGAQLRQEVERKAFFKQRDNAYWSEIKFTFPMVKIGSIIEYRYTSNCKHYGGLDDWDFQSELPVLRSHYNLTILPNLEFSYVVRKSKDMQIDIKKNERNASVSFAMENIPGLRDEPYMDARRDYLQRVEFQLSGYNGSGFDKRKYMTSWEEVIRELTGRSDFIGQLNKNLDGTDDFIKLAKQRPSLERMDAVYNFVRKNMGWNGVKTRFSPDGIKSAWNKKNSTSGDVNLILINLLKAADLEAYPMLVSERGHGKVDPNIPFVDQFNNVYAAVVIDGKKYYLDATNKFTPARIIPYEILNTTALILNRKAGGIVNITDESVSYQDNINISATVNEDGQLHGKTYISGKDYARTIRLRRYKRDSKTYIDQLREKSSGILIDSFSIMNEDVDSLPLQHVFSFNGTLNKTGDYIFIPFNLFSGYESNPFITDNRLTNINFGYKQQVNVFFNSTVPAGYAIDALPKSIQLTNPDKTIQFTRQLFSDEANNRIVARIRIDLSRTLYTTEEYPELKEFYKKMFELLNEPIVLRKK